jgi:hypothetical protein
VNEKDEDVHCVDFFMQVLPTNLNKRMRANAHKVEEILKGIITKRERAMKERGSQQRRYTRIITGVQH